MSDSQGQAGAEPWRGQKPGTEPLDEAPQRRRQAGRDRRVSRVVRVGVVGCAAAIMMLAGPMVSPAAGGDDPPSSSTTEEAAKPAPTPAPTPEKPAPESPSIRKDDAEVEVILKDGQRLIGILVESNAEVLKVRIAGIVTPLATELIEHYKVLPPIMERYLELRQAVGEDAEQILQLAQWLREREKYELALVEVSRALGIDPALPQGKSLKVQLEQQIILKQRRLTGGQGEKTNSEKASSEPAASKPAQGKGARTEFPLLTRDQINLLKVYEVDLESKPRLVIPRDVVTRMMEQNAGHPLVPITREGREAVYRKSPTEILEMMFKLQARTLYKDVQVLDQPESFQMFRDSVQRTWLLPRCATAECHGGSQAGRLMLYPRQPNSEQTVYTNFLILNRHQLSDGTPLLNVEEPAKSPLLQLGLHPNDSLYPHPEVKDSRGRNLFKQVFTWTDDPQFTEAVEWMKKLFRPRPDYPIDYTPPTGRAREVEPQAPEPASATPATPSQPGDSSSPTPDGEPSPR